MNEITSYKGSISIEWKSGDKEDVELPDHICMAIDAWLQNVEAEKNNSDSWE